MMYMITQVLACLLTAFPFCLSFQILETSSSLKTCIRVGAVLRRLILGLLVNSAMTSEDILLLSHGLISQSLPLLTKRDRSVHTANS